MHVSILLVACNFDIDDACNNVGVDVRVPDCIGIDSRVCLLSSITAVDVDMTDDVCSSLLRSLILIDDEMTDDVCSFLPH